MQNETQARYGGAEVARSIAEGRPSGSQQPRPHGTGVLGDIYQNLIDDANGLENSAARLNELACKLGLPHQPEPPTHPSASQLSPSGDTMLEQLRLAELRIRQVTGGLQALTGRLEQL